MSSFLDTFVLVLFFIASISAFSQSHEVVTMSATLQPRKLPDLFRFPSGHPLELTSNDFSIIHPKDEIHLSFDTADDSYILILKPNLQFIHPDIHNEAASMQYSDDHPTTQLSKVKSFEGDVFAVSTRPTLVISKSNHVRSKTTLVGKANIIILKDGIYQPSASITQVDSNSNSIQHMFINPEVHGSIFLGDDMFVLDSAQNYFGLPLSEEMTLKKNEGLAIDNNNAILPPKKCEAVRKDRLPLLIKRGRPVSPNRKFKPSRGLRPQGNTKVADITIAVDCHYYNKFKDGVTDRIMKLYNTVSSIYERNFNIKIRIGQAIVEKSCGTNSWNVRDCGGYKLSRGLNKFKEWLKSSRPPGNSRVALSNLFTGCEGEGLAGLGDVGVLCTQAGASITTIQENEFNVVSHEMGHGLGANHDCTSDVDCCACPKTSNMCSIDKSKVYVMYPSVTDAHDFSPCTKIEIMRIIKSSGQCLRDADDNESHHIENNYDRLRPLSPKELDDEQKDEDDVTEKLKKGEPIENNAALQRVLSKLFGGVI